MSENTIRKNWMTIGTNDKKLNIISNNNRVKTGAKGIGRFALDRIGKKCKLLSITTAQECVLWEVDWSQFESKDAIISEIKAELSVKDGTIFKNEILKIVSLFNLSEDILINWSDNKGTLIEITDLRDTWDYNSILSLFSNLESLTPPLENSLFSIYLYDSDEINQFGKVESADFDDYDYKLVADVDEYQNVNLTITRNELDIDELRNIDFFDLTKLDEFQFSQKVFEERTFQIKTTLNNLLTIGKSHDLNSSLLQIGPFKFTFYYLRRGGGQEDKESGIGKYPFKSINYRDRNAWLNKFGGIKIFRDNFRVRPYGEVGSSSWDWLEMGRNALKNPTVTRPGYRVRPQQVYGAINISRIGNINFDDKSSREGIQENSSFLLFKEIIKSIINVYESDRNQIMISLKKIYDVKNKKEKVKNDADDIVNSKTATETENENVLKDAIKIYKDEIDELIDEQKLLRVLASTGLIVTSFTHELKNLSDNLVPRTEDLKISLIKCIDTEKLKKLPEHFDPYQMLDDMRSQDLRLKSWLDFALSSVRKDKRKRRMINLVEYIEILERSWSSLLSRRHITLLINKYMFTEVYFKGFEIDLDGIFNNLISNSVDAFSRPESNGDRIIKLSFVLNLQDFNGINILYEDSGPGLDSQITNPYRIFEPFFTTKRDVRTGEEIGTGLGLWLVKSTIDEYNGKIELIENKPGFAAKIILPHHL